MNTYDVGDKVTLSAAFTNAAGAATDPTTITCKVKPRYGATTTYTYPATITKTGTGAYYVDVTLDTEGIWDYRFEGTGAVVAAAEGQLNVRDSAFS